MEMEVGLWMKVKEYKRIIGHPGSRPSMKETTLCPICRHAVIDRWSFCPFCGIKLAPVIKEIYNE